MVYGWKMQGLYQVEAQTAGEELERIYKERGKLDNADIVDESRPETAPLHFCFEWRDPVAAEKYREIQASDLNRCLVVVVEPEQSDADAQPVIVRAFPHADGTYHPYQVAVSSKSMRQEMLEDALRSMEAFKRKFDTLSCVSKVIDAIDVVSQEIREELDT